MSGNNLELQDWKIVCHIEVGPVLDLQLGHLAPEEEPSSRHRSLVLHVNDASSERSGLLFSVHSTTVIQVNLQLHCERL